MNRCPRTVLSPAPPVDLVAGVPAGSASAASAAAGRASRQATPGLALRILVGAAVLWVAGGAACYRRTRVADLAPPPEVFTAVPTLDELAAAVNRTDAIQKLQSNSASVTAPSMSDVSLKATLVLERPQRFRMKASIRPLPTTLVDLGSNEQVFWMQVPEGMTHTLYFASHERYSRQANRVVLPVDPSWLIDALGLVHLDPATVTEGPIRRPDGQLVVRSTLAMPDGEYRRVCVIDEKTAVVTEQYLYGRDNQLVARAIASQHVYYPEQQCALPHAVQIHLQPAVGPPLMLEMEVGDYSINQILSGDPQLFVMPQNAGQHVDLAELGGAAPTVVPPPAWGAATSPPAELSLRGERPTEVAPYPTGLELPAEFSAAAGNPTEPAAQTAELRYASPRNFQPSFRGLR